MAVALIGGLGFFAPVTATPSDESGEVVTERVELERADPQELLGILEAFEVEARVDGETRAIVLRGAREEVEAAREVIWGLDRPAPSELLLEIEVSLIAASPEGKSSARLAEPLQQALDRLQASTGLRSFELLDTVVLRTGAKTSGKIEGQLPGDAPQPARYELRFEEVSPLPGELPPIVRFRGLSFLLQDVVMESAEEAKKKKEKAEVLPTAWTSLETDVDLRAGQKVAIGKVAVLGDERALMLVLEVRVEEPD